MADAFEKRTGRFVVGVLGHQLALEGALQVGLNLHFKLVNHREAALGA
jgi:hypothetical protein